MEEAKTEDKLIVENAKLKKEIKELKKQVTALKLFIGGHYDRTRK